MWKEYIKSSIITFLVGFCMVILSQIDNITLESFRNGVAAGIGFAAIRAGFKAAIELFLTWYNK